MVRPEDLASGDPLINPAPTDEFGRILRAKLFLFDFEVGPRKVLQAQMAASQSARIEIWNLDGERLESAATGNVNAPPLPDLNGGGTTHSTSIDLDDLEGGSYILSLSSFHLHDSIALSVGGAAASEAAIQGLVSVASLAQPEDSFNVIGMESVIDLQGPEGETFVVEQQIDGAWDMVLPPFLTSGEVEMIPLSRMGGGPLRVRNLRTNQSLPTNLSQGFAMAFATRPGGNYALQGSGVLAGWNTIDRFVGTGGSVLRVPIVRDPKMFYRVIPCPDPAAESVVVKASQGVKPHPHHGNDCQLGTGAVPFGPRSTDDFPI